MILGLPLSSYYESQMQEQKLALKNSVLQIARDVFCAFVTTSFVFAFSATLAHAQETERVLISAKHVYTVDGEVLSPGQVLVQDGKIAFVGARIDPSGPVQELQVDTLIPGLINAASSAGLSGGDAEVSREITPDFDTASAIDFESRDFAELVDGGVTTAQVLPGTDSVFCGFSAIVKTAGSKIIEPENKLTIAICSDPTSRNRSRSRPDSIYVRQPTNRMGVVWIVRNTLHHVSQGNRTLALGSDDSTILTRALEGKLAVACVSRTDFDIRAALQLSEEYGFEPTIYGGDEVYRMVDEFKESGVSLVFTALTANGAGRALRGNEGTDLRWNVPGLLHQSAVSFCLGGDNLLSQAQFATRFGLPADEALRAITLGPAKMLRLENRIGSITVGKDADLVALSGNPLQPTSAIHWTMVSGKLLGNEE